MANEITSGILAAALNEKVINEAFEIARSNRTGLLAVVEMGGVRQAYDGYKMGWLDMRVDATSSATSASVLVGATTIPVTTGEGAKFRAGMTISPTGSQEVILVESVSGDTLTVQRGFGGTTAAALTSGQVITIDSVAREENSLAENDGIYQPENQENYFQTMDTAVEFSRRALATLQYGDTNDLTFQISERIKQLTIQLDRALIRGRKATATIGGKVRTYTGGLRYWLDQTGALKTDAAAAALTLDMIDTLNAAIVSRGGNSDTLVVPIKQARKISSIVRANYSPQTLGNWQADQGSVLSLPSDLPLIGNVNRIVIDTNLADDELILLDRGMVKVVPMAANNAKDSGAWQTKDATLPGQDGERTRIIGDFAIEVRQSKVSMARLYNLA
jgi:hypothetical protein